jgi:NAD(P)-dependent dehydrogenase (short-subunit alcohol dehydrogenase family)
LGATRPITDQTILVTGATDGHGHAQVADSVACGARALFRPAAAFDRRLRHFAHQRSSPATSGR